MNTEKARVRSKRRSNGKLLGARVAEGELRRDAALAADVEDGLHRIAAEQRALSGIPDEEPRQASPAAAEVQHRGLIEAPVAVARKPGPGPAVEDLGLREQLQADGAVPAKLEIGRGQERQDVSDGRVALVAAREEDGPEVVVELPEPRQRPDPLLFAGTVELAQALVEEREPWVEGPVAVHRAMNATLVGGLHARTARPASSRARRRGDPPQSACCHRRQAMGRSARKCVSLLAI